MIIKRIVGRMLPRGVRDSLINYRILSREFGQYRSIASGQSIDRAGMPIPWYSYPAIEYIRQLDFSDKAVFEYGSGNSTLFWAARSKSVVAVEDDHAWYERVRQSLPDHVEYLLKPAKDDYVSAISNVAGPFDVIIIDGSHRYDCAVAALPHLASDGFVILDNSDWKTKTSQLLRDADLIEVDMSGFGPINGYTTTTSFYFTRSVILRPAGPRQPMHGIGSVPHLEE